MELHRGANCLLLLLLLLSLLMFGDCSLQPQEAKIVASLGDVLHSILARTCVAHNMSISISSWYREQLPLEQRRLVERVLNQRNLLVPMVLDTHLLPPASTHLHLVLLFVQDASQLVAAISRNAHRNVIDKFKYLVVLLAGAGVAAEPSWQMREMRQVFDYFLHGRYNVDVLLLLAHLELGRVDSYTYWPYASGRPCESTQPLPQPLQGASLRQLYPQKLHNLHGCPLHIIVWQLEPFIELHPHQARITGLDANIVNVLADKLNFRPALVTNDPPELIGGTSYMNGTMTGAYRMLQQRRGNFTLGCALCLPSRFKHLASTLPYGQLEYVLVMRRAPPYSAYEIMLFPFASGVWLLLGALLTLRLLCWLLGWRLVGPVHIAWTMFLFLLRIGYESSVFVFVHNSPSRPLPHSLEQAIQLDYNFIVDHAIYRMTELLPALKARTRILPGQPVDIFDQLLALPADSRTAVISSHFFLSSYLNKRRELHNRFVLAGTKIMDYMNCGHFPQGSYLAGRINDVLFFMRSSGITQHIGARFRLSHLATTTTVRMRPLHGACTTTTDAAHFMESMRFIFAALNCLLLAESLTLCIFALELLSLRIRWLSTLFRLI